MSIGFVWPQTMRGQLILTLFGILLVAQCASTWVFFEERRSALRAFTAKDGASRVLNVARELERAPDETRTTILRAAESRELRLDVDLAALTERADAEPLAGLTGEIRRLLEPRAVDLTIALAKPDAAGLSRSPSHEDDWDDDPYMLVISAALDDGRFLNAWVDIGEPPLQWAWPALISILLMACGVIAAVWLLAGHMAAPMAALADASARLGKGEALEPLVLRGPTEVRQVTEAFNEMAWRLTKLLKERAQMLAALGHDLRSPITAMRLRVDMLEDTHSRERLEICLDEIQSLVQAALALARGASTDEPRVAINLHDLLYGLVCEVIEAGGKATLDAPSNMSLMARPDSLKRALRNIAENAVRYGDTAIIRALRCRNYVQIKVEDNGPGIEVADRERVFEPFVRLETSRSRDTGGSGLGLSIARTIIEAHGGSITLEEARARGGTCAIVLLPVL